MSTLEELVKLIGEKGEEIRLAKASNSSKETISPLVAQLVTFKER